MDDMLKDFVVEAMDLATNVEEHLLRLERDPDNKETLNAVFRSFHTIKGGAGFMGLPALVAADSSSLYARNVLDFLKLVVDKEAAFKLDLDDDIVAACLMTHQGEVTRK